MQIQHNPRETGFWGCTEVPRTTITIRLSLNIKKYFCQKLNCIILSVQALYVFAHLKAKAVCVYLFQLGGSGLSSPSLQHAGHYCPDVCMSAFSTLFVCCITIWPGIHMVICIIFDVCWMQEDGVAKVKELDKMLNPKAESFMKHVLREFCKDAR